MNSQPRTLGRDTLRVSLAKARSHWRRAALARHHWRPHRGGKRGHTQVHSGRMPPGTGAGSTAEPCHQEQAGRPGTRPPVPREGAVPPDGETKHLRWPPVSGGGGPRKPGGDLQGRVAAKAPLWAPRAAPGVFLTGLLSFSVGLFARRGRAGSWPPSLRFFPAQQNYVTSFLCFPRKRAFFAPVQAHT